MPDLDNANNADSVLIIGAGGQDGFYLRREFSKMGWTVFPTFRKAASDIRYFEGEYPFILDVTDADAVKGILDQTRPSIIVNLASLSSVAECNSNPILSKKVNHLAVSQLLDILSEGKSKSSCHFIQASSSEMYSGGTETRMINENSEPNPGSVYGEHKLSAHLELVQRRQSGDISGTSAILFNHESPLRSEKFVSRKIVRAVCKIKKNQQMKLELGNIESERDWGYAPDYMNAIVKMAKTRPASDYVIASGQLNSVENFCKIAFSVVDLDWKQYVGSSPDLHRAWEHFPVYGDNARAAKELDWKPNLNFEEMIRHMVMMELNNSSD